jgi:2-polyprenyl-6-methoxyphenol hydroxylase-like FAD-dependent oxidoreductase
MAKRHAEIAGAGFAGMTLAAALAQRGWSVRIHERASECRQFGAGIWIWENGLRVLDALGVIESALDGAVMNPRWESYDERGKLISRTTFGDHQTGGRTYCIVRQQLFEAIQAAALRNGVEILTDSKAAGATPEGQLITETHVWPADLVVGADGVNSAVRESLGLLHYRWKHGDSAIRVIIPRTEEEAAADKWSNVYEWWNGPRRVLYTPCSRHQVYLCLTSRTNDTAAFGVPIPKESWVQSFPHIAHLLERMPDSGRSDIFETIYAKRWFRGRTALVGDAAHGMVPGLGQGCGCALHNAFALATILEQTSSVEKALLLWERRGLAMTRHTQRWSWILWPMTTVPAPVARSVFNFPGLSGWLNNQRAKPAQYIAQGTENRPRWTPRPSRSGSPAPQFAGAELRGHG